MNDRKSKHIEVADGYRRVWRNVSEHKIPKEDGSALASTIRAARKHLAFSGIEDQIRLFVKSHPVNPHCIISLGCGTAQDLAVMKDLFPSASFFGVDTSREALAIAKKKHDLSRLNLICASIANFPFKKTAVFDMFIAGQCIDLDFEEDFMLETLKEITAYSSTDSLLYLTFYGTSDSQLELYKCTPIGNALSKLNWSTLYGIGYNLEKRGKYAQGVFWVEERVERSKRNKSQKIA